MPKWPIRVKLIAGLSLVVGMMLTLMGGAIFSLSAFHDSNLMHTDLLRELGASKDLDEQVARLEAPRRGTAEEVRSIRGSPATPARPWPATSRSSSRTRCGGTASTTA